MVDLSNNYKNFNIVLKQFENQIDETERSVVAAVGKINHALTLSNSLVIARQQSNNSLALQQSSDRNEFYQSSGQSFADMLDNHYKMVDYLQQIAQNTGKIDSLAKGRGDAEGKVKTSVNPRYRTYKDDLNEGIGKFTDSFDSFKDAISTLADRFLTIGDMGNIADHSYDLQNFADMTGSKVKDVFQAINVGNRYGVKEQQSLMFYKDMANINQALATGDTSQLRHRKELEQLNQVNGDVLKSGLTPEQRMEAIRAALQKMQASNDPKEQAEALAIARTLGHDISGLVKLLTDKENNYQKLKKDENKNSNVEDLSAKQNAKTSDAKAKLENTNTANNHKATADAGGYMQWKSKFLNSFIQHNEGLVAGFKATVAITDDVNDKFSLLGKTLDGLIGLLGMLTGGKLIGKGLLKGGKELKKAAQKKYKERRAKRKGNASEKKPAEDKAKSEDHKKDSDHSKRKQKAKDQTEQKAKDQTEQKAKEQAEQKAKEQAEQKAKEQAEQKIKEKAGKGVVNAAEKTATKGSRWGRMLKFGKKFGTSIAKITLKRLPQKLAASAASGWLGPGMAVVDAALFAKDLYDAYQEVTQDGDNEGAKSQDQQPQKDDAKKQEQQQKSDEAKQKAKEEFKKKVEQSKKELQNKQINDLPLGTPLILSPDGQRTGPYTMSSSQDMVMAKQTQLASTTLNTNNNQKFNTVINVNSMATDPKLMAQEVKQALSNRMLAQAYGVPTSDSNQRATANQA